MLKTRNTKKQVTCTKEHLQRSRYLKPVLVDLKNRTRFCPFITLAPATRKGELTPSVMDNPRKRIWHLQFSDTRAVPSDTRAVSPDTRAVFSDTERAVFSDTRAVPSDTRAVFSNTSAVFSDTRAVSSDTRAVLSTRELCPPTRGLCPPTPKLCPTTREMCPPTRDFAYRHESCQAGHVAIGNTTVVSTTCTRNWGNTSKTRPAPGERA